VFGKRLGLGGTQELKQFRQQEVIQATQIQKLLHVNILSIQIWLKAFPFSMSY